MANGRGQRVASRMSISPPPWSVQPYDALYESVVSAPGRDGFREIVALVNGADRDANAALICAAPELADAVRRGDWVRAAAIVAELDAG